MQRQTSTIPIVFVNVTDPVGQGFVASISRPGGNITGFTDFDPPLRENDPMGQTRAKALVEALGALNWKEGDNIRIDWRWAGSDPALFQRYATELVALRPDLLLANGTPSVAARPLEALDRAKLTLKKCHSDILANRDHPRINCQI
jgi:hypothetical protein